MPTIAIANQKGGVGKTTTAMNIAASIALSGRKTLLVDIDPQGNATSGLGQARARTGGAHEALFAPDRMPATISPTDVAGLFLCPASRQLGSAETELANHPDRALRFRRAIETVKSEYDYILVDCPPSLGLLPTNALAAADALLIPIQCEYYAMEGLAQMLELFQKLLFTRDGEKDIPVIRGSSFNLIVTNTEKIRIQKETIRKSDLGGLFGVAEDQAKAEVANLRLQAIASLPHLAVFSDEAHHTYGQSMTDGLKKVRRTVDYLAEQTNVIVVVNTTGTPYYRRQGLKDVVYWYGLAQGIREGYLKDLADSILAYSFDRDAAVYVDFVIRDFFKDYGAVRLPSGAPAKLAIYFPQTSDLAELRPVIEKALVDIGQDPALCLVNTSDTALTSQIDIDAFNRLNDPAAPHRVMLLVNKGTEGWNCPSLFGCALARKLRTSNNFVLQASTRCLRQVPGNLHKARVYLSTDNYNILDRQLQETYGESIHDLNWAVQETRRARIVVHKLDLSPVLVSQIVRTVVKKQGEAQPLVLRRPEEAAAESITQRIFTIEEQRATYRVMRQVGDALTIEAMPDTTDAYAAAVDLAARYRLDLWQVYDELRRVYGADEIPLAHLDPLARQIEEQTCFYEVREERRERALALIRKEGFSKETDADGAAVYTAEIMYPKDREHLLARLSQWQDRAGQFGFHYDPYNFDSKPEADFFEAMLREINLKPEEVEDIYFTGAITDPGKTDFFVWYKNAQGGWSRYFPDFVIRKKPGRGRKRGTGRTYIVEIKREQDRSHPTDGAGGRKEMAIRTWIGDPDRLRYEIIFTGTEKVVPDSTRAVRQFIQEPEADAESS